MEKGEAPAPDGRGGGGGAFCMWLSMLGFVFLWKGSFLGSQKKMVFFFGKNIKVCTFAVD